MDLDAAILRFETGSAQLRDGGTAIVFEDARLLACELRKLNPATFSDRVADRMYMAFQRAGSRPIAFETDEILVIMFGGVMTVPLQSPTFEAIEKFDLLCATVVYGLFARPNDDSYSEALVRLARRLFCRFASKVMPLAAHAVQRRSHLPTATLTELADWSGSSDTINWIEAPDDYLTRYAGYHLGWLSKVMRDAAIELVDRYRGETRSHRLGGDLLTADQLARVTALAYENTQAPIDQYVPRGYDVFEPIMMAFTPQHKMREMLARMERDDQAVPPQVQEVPLQDRIAAAENAAAERRHAMELLRHERAMRRADELVGGARRARRLRRR